MMPLNIARFFTRNPLKFSVTNTTVRYGIAFVVYFLLFTFIVSSSLFVSGLQIAVDEPSPQNIPAPWDKDIEDYDKYQEDIKKAVESVKKIYKPDETYINELARDLPRAFLTIRDAISSKEDDQTKVSRMRQLPPFNLLTDSVLLSLTKTTVPALEDYEQKATVIIIGGTRNPELGAKTNEDVPALRERMKQELAQTLLPDDMKAFLKAFVDSKITRPTLVKDEQATAREESVARASVKLEVQRYKANQKIVGQGEIVNERIYKVLLAYGLVIEQSPWRSVGGIAIIVLVSMAVLAIYVRQYKSKIPQIGSKVILIGITITLVLVTGKAIFALNLGGLEFNSLAGMLIPVAWATMAVAILVDAELAILTAIIIAVFVGILTDPLMRTTFGVQTAIVALFGGIVGVYSVSHLSQRSDLARAGIYVGAANVLTISGLALISGTKVTPWVVGLVLGVVNGLLSSVLTVGTLHWLESGFRITSAVRLLELSNPNRPLLKRLLMEAPGTYHHSILVGNLAEAAAEEVNADSILVRVGAMYHDIGKLKRPYFFIENQFAQENPHDKIAPTLSSLIITSHIKDGLEMAKEYKLPQSIQDIIAQHHGDSLVSFFYHKAIEENMDVPKEAFLYDGPRPQTKEAALVSLADSVEAAVRSMKQPTPGKIEGLVRKIIKDKLNDGQLDQSDLTFQDLDRIAMAFVRVLSGIFHSRVEYPELPNKGGEKDTESQDEKSRSDETTSNK